ncbi:hypothetical protein ACFO4E_02505 [Nocardiopsis mangrovi]|uniref:Uncharacterized protein n=1 Tax=Nocardiopsis mangrovi TaxID=1179818 RepID=A0ABV9DQ25_9ACTN
MRKHHGRWIAIAGATTVSLAGFGALGVGFADEQRPPEDWPISEQEQEQEPSDTVLDGFEIGYLPPGLAQNGIHTTSKAGSDGERRSSLSWLRGREGVYGRVDIFRSDHIADLDDVRTRYFRDLDARALRKVDSEGRTAYRSDATGDIFWFQEKGVAVAAHLAPDTWDTEELSRFAAGIRPREPEPSSPSGPDSVFGGNGPTSGAAGPQFPPAVPGATAPNARPDVAPGVSADEVQACLIEQLESGGAGAGQDAESAPDLPFWDSARSADTVEAAEADARLIGMLEESGDAARSAAVTACKDRFGLTDRQVNTLISDIGDDVRADTGGEEGGAATAPLAAPAPPDPDGPSGAAEPSPAAPEAGAEPDEGAEEAAQPPATGAADESEGSGLDLLGLLGLGDAPLTITLGR